MVWAEFPPVISLYALQNQAMICGELDRLTPAAFQTELRDCLVDYYEKVCLMVGAGGALSIKTHKRKYKAAATSSEVIHEGVEDAAGDIEVNVSASESPPTKAAKAARTAAAAEATPSPGKPTKVAGGKAVKARAR